MNGKKKSWFLIFLAAAVALVAAGCGVRVEPGSAPDQSSPSQSVPAPSSQAEAPPPERSMADGSSSSVALPPPSASPAAEPTDPERIAVPECLQKRFDKAATGYYDYSMAKAFVTRKDNGFDAFVPPYMEKKLFEATVALGLRPAQQDEKPAYTLRYPFRIEYPCDGGHLHSFDFEKGSILVDDEWEAVAAGDPDAFGFLYDEMDPFEWLAFELLQLRDIMPFDARDIVKIEYTSLDEEETSRQGRMVAKTEIYEGEAAMQVYETKLSWLIIRKLLEGETTNPPGGIGDRYQITSANGQQVDVSWCIFIDGRQTYSNLEW